MNGEKSLRAVGDALRRPANHVAARVTSAGPKWCARHSIDDLPARVNEAELREGSPLWRAYNGYVKASDEIERRCRLNLPTTKAKKRLRQMWRALEIVLSPRDDV